MFTKTPCRGSFKADLQLALCIRLTRFIKKGLVFLTKDNAPICSVGFQPFNVKLRIALAVDFALAAACLLAKNNVAEEIDPENILGECRGGKQPDR